jgi:transcriptional regulator with XRE-family HTH domain
MSFIARLGGVGSVSSVNLVRKRSYAIKLTFRRSSRGSGSGFPYLKGFSSYFPTTPERRPAMRSSIDPGRVSCQGSYQSIPASPKPLKRLPHQIHYAALRWLLRREVEFLTDGIGPLLAIRLQRQLSLHDVEEQSVRLAQEWGNEAYCISAGWLDSLEREEHEMSLSTLLVLANIYNLPAEQLLRPIFPGGPHAPNLLELSVRNSTSRFLTPDHTTVLPADNGTSRARFGRGVIGKHDRTLDPMVPPGSMVHIDTNERVIPTRRNWADAFHRPIFFLLTRDGYACGWCELGEDPEWLTLTPHPLSPVPARRWKYRTEIENVGRVVAVSVPLAE